MLMIYVDLKKNNVEGGEAFFHVFGITYLDYLFGKKYDI